MQILSPDYYNDFACTGSECPDTCCGKWVIDIDEETLKKYDGAGEGCAKEFKNSFITVGGHTVINFQNNYCPLLSKNRLCRIYTELGEDKMPSLCREYPRSEWIYGDMKYRTLILSCPEVARILTDHKPPLTFTLDELPPARDENNSKWDGKKLAYVFTGMNISIDLMQLDGLPLTKRLQLLLFFNHEFEAALKDGKSPDELFDSFTDAKTVSELSGNMDVFGKNEYGDRTIIFTFLRHFKETYSGGELKEYLLDLLKNIGESSKTCSFCRFTENSFISGVLENYCVYYIANYYMNCYYDLEFEKCIAIMFDLCLIQSGFLGMFAKNREVTRDDVINIFYNTSRAFEHCNNKYAWENIYRMMSENNLNNFQYLISICNS